MLWFLIVLAGIGLTVQAWLTIRGFGPPSPPDQLDPDYRDERVLLGAPAAELLRYTVPHAGVERTLVRLHKREDTPDRYPRRFKKIQTDPL